MNEDVRYTSDIEAQMVKFEDLLIEEQESLWYDLFNAMHYAINGYWSIDVESKLYRICRLIDATEPVKWEKIQIALLTTGIYQAVLTNMGLNVPHIDLEERHYEEDKSYISKWGPALSEIANFNWKDRD